MEHFQLDQITVIYSSQAATARALDAVSLSVRPAEWVALVGRNGSGKSTLARVIAGQLPVSAGTVRPGFAHSGGTRPEVCLVMQHPGGQLIGETVEEDVLLALELAGVPYERREERLEALLRAVGLQEKRSSRTAELSGGQQQLLAVAGCIAAGARLLVFDEATSMLDPGSRERLLACARDLNRQGLAIVWVTHAMEELVWSHRVAALEGGRLVYDGDVRGFFYGERGRADGAQDHTDGVQDRTDGMQDRTDGKQDRTDGKKQEVDLGSPCERLGFEAPFAVQTVRELRARGIAIRGRPLTWEELEAELEVLLT